MMRSSLLTVYSLSILAVVLCGISAVPNARAEDTCDAGKYKCHDACIPEKDLCLLEPLGDGAPISIPADQTMKLGAIRYYINAGNGLWKIILSMGAALAVLQGIVAGFQIAYGGQASLDQAKSRFTWAVIGLLMLMLSGVLLTFINPIGFSSTL